MKDVHCRDMGGKDSRGAHCVGTGTQAQSSSAVSVRRRRRNEVTQALPSVLASICSYSSKI